MMAACCLLMAGVGTYQDQASGYLIRLNTSALRCPALRCPALPCAALRCPALPGTVVRTAPALFTYSSQSLRR